ncbi:M48 family metalloprotease [Hamadaea tsunoensis]|uniref:M48 family metalloprotease n=1 Tax=Hamadaea tsunoensis TaxID=53368 RepID=UPI00040688C4|nr:M48 family metalloprotease [Hamadaea tsunoensis]
MTVAVYLPLLFCAGLAGLAGPVARRVPPGWGLWSLTFSAVSGALGAAWSLCLLAGMLIDDLPIGRRLPGLVPVPDAVSLLALAALVAAGVRVTAAMRSRAREQAALSGFARTADDIIIGEDDRADAFAVPARGWLGRGPGKVVVTTGLLRLLTPAQQRALFAHEHAHLSGHHAAARTATSLAAAALPPLIPVRAAVSFLCERQADEAAATATGDRRLVAKTIATAALARSSGRGAPLALHRLAVIDRVAALLGERPHPRGWQLIVLATMVAAMMAGVLEATGDSAAIALSLLHS